VRVAALHRFPVKGLSAEPLDAVDLVAGEGVPGDRRYAVLRGDAEFDVARPRWVPKEKCLMLMRDAALASIQARLDATTRELTLELPDGRSLRASLASEDGRSRLAELVASVAGSAPRGATRLVEAGPLSFTDVPENCVSIIHRASVDDLAARIGRPLHPLRFRANVYLEGGTAWQELGWLGRRLELGDVMLRPFARIPRCAATSVDPETGVRDLSVPKALEQHYGHHDMGLYAEVVRGGRIAVGDGVSLREAPDTRQSGGAMASLLRTARLYGRQGVVLARDRLGRKR